MRNKNEDKLFAKSVLAISRTAIGIGSYIRSLSEKAFLAAKMDIVDTETPESPIRLKMAFVRAKRYIPLGREPFVPLAANGQPSCYML